MTTTAPRLIRLADVPGQPWRNGGGVTRELLAGPAAAWRWRISVAEIAADGPFSPFPGVERWFAVVSGAGVELDFAGTLRRQRPGDAPLRFDGAAAPGCRLIDGPTHDLNLMLRGAAGAMRQAQAGAPWAPQSVQAGLYTAVAGTVSDPHGQSWPVPADALLWFDAAPATLALEVPADARAWWLGVDAPSAGGSR